MKLKSEEKLFEYSTTHAVLFENRLQKIAEKY